MSVLDYPWLFVKTLPKARGFFDRRHVLRLMSLIEYHPDRMKKDRYSDSEIALIVPGAELQCLHSQEFQLIVF